MTSVATPNSHIAKIIHLLQNSKFANLFSPFYIQANQNTHKNLFVHFIVFLVQNQGYSKKLINFVSLIEL